VVLGVGVAGADVGAAAVGEVSIAVRFVVAGVGAAVATIALVARSLRSLTVTQLAMSISLGIETIVATTARLQSTITTLARGPVPIRHAMVALARDRVPPNLAQLWVLRTVPSGPARRTAALIFLDQRGYSLGYCRGRGKSIGEGLHVLVGLVISPQALEMLRPAA
jgi:hypothetical protein